MIPDAYIITLQDKEASFEEEEGFPVTQVLVDGLNELAQIIGLLTKSHRYVLLGVETFGKIYNGKTILNELINDNKPQDLDFGIN